MKIQGSGAPGGEGAPGASPLDFLLSHGFDPKTAPELDGKLHRYTHNCGSGQAAWAVFHAEPFPRGRCGCHRCGLDEKWNALGRELTEDERKAIDRLAKVREAEVKARQESLADYLNDVLLPTLRPATAVHPVCEKKGILPCGALQKTIGEAQHEILLVPLVDTNWKAWTLQGIATAPIREFGGMAKSYEKGGKISGCFAPIGLSKESQPDRLLICEGFATGATLHQATGLPVLCAMQANNMANVAKEARSKWPQANITVCADNDRHGKENAGVEFGEEAALVIGAGLAIPDFGDLPAEKHLSDYNDLARERGLEEVARQVNEIVPPERPAIFYEMTNKSWWMKGEGIFIPYNETGIKRALHIGGMARYAKGDNPSAIDLEVQRLTLKCNVDYAGPVAGWPAGVHMMGGSRILVTKPCRLLAGENVPFATLESILVNMLGWEQTARLLLWIRVYRERIRTRRWHPLPVLIIVGPKNCGKSLIQEIISILVGNRIGKPMQFMLGSTDFNAELIGSEHLIIEDETSRGDAQSRRHLGEQIKSLFFARNVMCHKKNGTPITVNPLWGLSMTVNNEPEHVMVIPTIDASLADKVLILKAEYAKRPVPDGMLERDWLPKILEAEVPGLAFYADNFDLANVPQGLFDDRTIVAAWQHPEILGMIADQSTESHFWTVVESVLFGDLHAIHSTWKGSAEELTRKLLESDYRREAEKLLSWPTACGTYLGRAMVQNPTRIRRHLDPVTRRKRWTISPPGFDVSIC